MGPGISVVAPKRGIVDVDVVEDVGTGIAFGFLTTNDVSCSDNSDGSSGLGINGILLRLSSWIMQSRCFFRHREHGRA